MKYHVFLSFRGEDTRKTFTDHLYAALRRKGIVTFRDDEELERGQVISDKLMKAIEESLFAIVILSHDYASSSWCLEELHHIVESRQDLGCTVFPVFYGINPSDIRHQRGNIGKAFEKHEEKVTQDKVQRWRKALTDVANLAGWYTRDKHEAVIIDDIVEAVWTILRSKLPSDFDHLVGIQSKVDTIMSHLKIGLDDICFIGIWGMGGIGKTTLARVVYEAIQNKFESNCFLANVRDDAENIGLVHLQKKLLSCLQMGDMKINDSLEGVKIIRQFLCRRKVLIVLDDVSHTNQLKNLAGNKNWFGTGSKIIITTRDMHLLTQYEQFDEYNVEKLNSDESLTLLCHQAFKKDDPDDGYMELSKKVVEYAGGLPLALEVLGSFLCKRSLSEWRDTLDKMKKQNLHKDILETLRISYDGLEDEEYQTIFLDIACFFNRKKKVEVTNILEPCGLHPTIGIKVLIEKSLLNFEIIHGEEFLYMHDLLQEMGRNIVLQESAGNVGKCSRLWSEEKIDQVLSGNRGTGKVQSIVWSNLNILNKANWHPDCFSKMDNLKLLYLSNAHPSRGLNSLPSALKVLIWEFYLLEALPHNINQLHELVELRLHVSKIRQLWNGTPLLSKLKFIDLSFSHCLTKTSDFSGVPNLEILILEHCINLIEVHESLGHLRKLVKLNLKFCANLVKLPSKLDMDSLEEFILYECSKLTKLPEFGKSMKRLSILDLSYTKIREVPSSISNLTNLCKLSFRKCEGRAWNSWRLFEFFGYVFASGLKLPESFSNLSSLKKLDLSDCNLCDGSIPEDLSGLSSLMNLDLSGNSFVNLPTGCISKLVNLKILKLRNCPELESMPKLPPNLIRLDATDCPSMEPMVDVQHLVVSLVSKNHNILSPDESEVMLFRVPGNELPAWFEEREFHVCNNKRDSLFDLGQVVSLKVDIPDFGDKSEWLGIGVCHLLNHQRRWMDYSSINWRLKALDGRGPPQQIEGFHYEMPCSGPSLCIIFFPFRSRKGLLHGRGENLQYELDVNVQRTFGVVQDSGWRLIRKTDFEVCKSSSVSSSLQITELDKDK